MYTYLVCSETNEMLFQRQCAALEKHIPGLKKDPLLRDPFDDALIQAYRKDNAELIVYNSYQTGDLYIDSEFDLKPYFPHAKESPFVDE